MLTPVRYKAKLAYDGTRYHGFQRQAEDRTVQHEVEQALRRIGWKGTSILAAGRTDAGVHASGQVITFDMTWRHSLPDLSRAVNANLPGDAAVRELKIVKGDFHPRFDALSRTYQYRIYCSETRDPLRDRFAWHVRANLALGKLQGLSEKFPGRHDFSGYGTAPIPGGRTVREVFQSTWRQEDDAFIYTIEGNAFLYHMVRRIVYHQIETARGNNAESEIDEKLSGRAEDMVQGLAPPNGLVLVHVAYPEN